MKMEGKEVGCCLMKQCWLQKCPRFASIDHTSPELQFVISDRSCSIYPGHCHLREALILVKKRFFVKSLHKMVNPPRPPFMKSLFIFFPTIFGAKKKMILKVVRRVLMGVLGVFEGCCRVFEVCLKGVWKNKIEV